MAKSKQVIDLVNALVDHPERDEYLVRAELAAGFTTYDPDIHFKVVGWRWDDEKAQLVLLLEERRTPVVGSSDGRSKGDPGGS